MSAEALQGVAERVRSPDVDVHALFAEDLTAALSDAAAVETNAADLAQGVMAFLAVSGRAGARGTEAVQAFVDRAVAQDAFMKQLTAAIVKAEKAFAKARPQHCLILLGWVGSLLRVVPIPAAAKAAEALAKVQLRLLDLASADPALANQAVACAAAPLQSRPAALGPVYTALDPPAFPSAGAVLHAASLGLDDAEDTEGGAEGGAPGRDWATRALEWYLKGVLGAKARPETGVVSLFTDVVRSAPAPFLEEQILPTASRMLKRAPEVVMGVLAHLMANLTDPEAAAKLMVEVQPSLLAALRHTDPGRQADAAAALAAFLRLAPTADAVAGAVGAVSEALLNKQLKGPSEKEAHARALRGAALALCSRGMACAACADATVGRLCTAAMEEPNEAVKGAFLATAAAWAPLLGTALPSEYLALLAQLDKDFAKEPVRRAQCVTACDIAWARPDLAPGLAPATASLARVVSEGVAKPTVRGDALCALLALILSARHDPAALAALQGQPFWHPALTQGSRLLEPPSSVARLLPDQSRCCARLCRVLLAPATAASLPDEAWASATACDILAHCLVREDAGECAAADCAQQVVHDGAHVEALLASILALVRDTEGTAALLKGAGMDSEPADVSDALRRALLRCLPREVCSLTPQSLATCMVAAMHANTLGGEGASAADSPWQGMSERCGGLDYSIAYHAGGVFRVLRTDLTGLDGDLQLAAARAAAAAVACAPETTWPHAHAALAVLLDRSDHDALTPMDRVVFATPPDALGVETDDGRALVLAEKTTLTMTDEDRAAAESLKLPLKKGEKPNPQAESRARQLAREAGSRRWSARICARLQLGLRLVRELCEAASGQVSSCLGELGDLVLPLLSSFMVGSTAAVDTTECLARCLPPPLQALSQEIARAIHFARTTAPAAFLANPIAGSVVRAIQLHTVGPSLPLPSPAYALVIPILEAVLTSGLRSKLHDPAISIVALHASPSAPLPRTRLFRSLYLYLEATPAAKYQVTPLLQQLGSGVSSPKEIGAVLEGLVSGAAHVRVAALAALSRVPAIKAGSMPSDCSLTAMLYTACFDAAAANASFAQAMFRQSGASVTAHPAADLTSAFLSPLLLASPHSDVRVSAGQALAAALERLGPEALDGALAQVLLSYVPTATASARAGVAAGLGACARLMTREQVMAAIEFLLSRGLADPAEEARSAMVASAQQLADLHGQAMASELVPLFESRLDRTKVDTAMDEDTYDYIREGAVLMLGTVARHIPPEDPKVKEVVEIILEALRTPSESVQRSCGQCLAPLAKRLSGDREYAAQLVDRLAAIAVASDSYADRRGAAFGLAGVVRGLGLVSLKQLNLMTRLVDKFESKKDVTGKEGALYSFAALTETLGKLFEPYVVRVLPLLLSSFGDGARAIQEAAGVAARAIMSKLTGHGVKLVLPHILKSLEDPAWRAKQGAVQLLASMAFCAPEQLGSALPQVVPKLGEVLSDPHPKVQDAARQALAEVGGTIENPEMKALVPVLLDAISHATEEPRKALDAILSTTFINTVDAASLALIVPVIDRGMRSQVGDVKRRACRILGSLCTVLTDPADMGPYLGPLSTTLRACIMDAGPEVRATAAKALGSLVQGLGEERFEGLIPWLMERIRSDQSAVERQGAAQGLAHVLAVLGGERLAEAMPEIVANTKHKSPYVREGHMTLLRYLPMALGQAFRPHLSASLSCVLLGLADESEGVRDAALRAGRTLVDMFAATSMQQLLPSVEEAMFSGDHRIRQASIELLGTLLFSAVGVHHKFDQSELADDEEAAPVSTAAQGEALRAQLGNDQYRSVLARLFIARSDVVLVVRSASLHVWKSLVDNTPRALNEILPTILDLSISNLSHAAAERREMCGRAVGELVRKLGERVIVRAVPILKEGVADPDPRRRQGACLGLQEVLESMTRSQLTEHLADLLPAIQDALTDDVDFVREAAGGALASLFQGGGANVVESVVPALMAGLEVQGSKSQKALEGLSVILSVRPGSFASMVPRLSAAPLTRARVLALSELAGKAGAAADAHVPRVLPQLLTAAGEEGDADLAAACQQAANHLAVLPEDLAEIALTVSTIATALETPTGAVGASRAAGHFCQHTKGDLMEHIQVLLPPLVSLLALTDAAAVNAAWEALGTLTLSIPKESYPSLVRNMRDAVGAATERARSRGEATVAGLCLPKGMQPIVPIYIQGLLQGTSTELRESAARGLGDLVAATTEEALKPFVLQITGPLIRIIGDRFPWEIKAAILQTLGLIIGKGRAALKPFVPQLQTSFLKCLTDTTPQVRGTAAANLGSLSRMSARVDQLATELASSAKVQDAASAEGFLRALRGVLHESGERLKEDSLGTIGEALRSLAAQHRGSTEHEATRSALAGCIGAFVGCATPADAGEMLATYAGGDPGVPREEIHFQALVLVAAARFSAARSFEVAGAAEIAAGIVRLARVDCFEARDCLGAAIAGFAETELAQGRREFTLAVLSAFPILLGPDMFASVQVNALRALRRMEEAKEGCLLDQQNVLLPALCTSVDALTGLHKIYAERTLGRIAGVVSGSGAVEAFLASGEASAGVRRMLNDTYLQRLMRLAETPEEEDEFDDLGL